MYIRPYVLARPAKSAAIFYVVLRIGAMHFFRANFFLLPDLEFPFRLGSVIDMGSYSFLQELICGILPKN